MNLATVTVSGTIAKDAEQRYTPNNTAIVSFTINSLRYDSRSKEEQAYPIKVNLWGDSYSNLLDQLKAGKRVIVSGRLQLNNFTTQDGKKVRAVEVEATSVSFTEDIHKLEFEAVGASAAKPSKAAASDSGLVNYDQLNAELASSAGSEEIPF